MIAVSNKCESDCKQIGQVSTLSKIPDMAPPRLAKNAKSADTDRRTRRGSTALSDAQPLSLEDLADKIDTFEKNK